MRVFVTGATGFIGSAVVKDLLGAGHQVLGLARSDERAKELAATGAGVHRGDLEDLDSLKRGAEACDGVIHTAFIHDFSKFAENGQVDKRAIAAMGEVLAGSNRPLVVSSGTAIAAMMSPGKLATEDLRAPADAPFPRVSEQAAEALVAQGVRSISIRLTPTVHGAGDHGFIPQIIETARAKGVSAYVGEGKNVWPAVHRFDAAQVFRLALEKGEAGGVYHAVAEQGITAMEIAAVIGRKLNLPVVSKPMAEAGEHFGFMAMFFGLDAPASSDWTQAQLGWKPTQIGLLADMDQNYF